MAQHAPDPATPSTAEDLALEIYRSFDPNRFESLVAAHGVEAAQRLMADAADLLERWCPRTRGVPR